MSFDVRPGETVGLVGESGAGKTVAARSLLRLVPDPGRIVGGEVWYRDDRLVGFADDSTPDETAVSEGAEGLLDRPFHPDVLGEAAMRDRIRGSEIAMIFQDPVASLNPTFSVGSQLREVVERHRDLAGADARDEAIRLLREVGLPAAEDRYGDYPHQLSGGMCQRVVIAMALACRPRLLVADEPTTALDVTVEGQILDLLRDLQAEYDTSVLWITHDLGVVAELCDRVTVAYAGETVEQAPVADLFDDPRHPYTEALLDAVPRPDEPGDSLDPIPGRVPDPSDPPVGCRFHPRCPHARAACRDVRPDCRPVADGDPAHRSACLRDAAFADVDYEESPPIESAGREATDQRTEQAAPADDSDGSAVGEADDA